MKLIEINLNYITIPKVGVVMLLCCFCICINSQTLVIDCERNLLREVYLGVSTNPFNKQLLGKDFAVRLDTILGKSICISNSYENPDLFYSISLQNRYLSYSFRKSKGDSIIIRCEDFEYANFLINLDKQISYKYVTKYKNKWQWLWPTFKYISERKLLKALKDNSYFISNIDNEVFDHDDVFLFEHLQNFERVKLLNYLLKDLPYDYILDYVYQTDVIDSIDWLSHLEFSIGNFNRTQYQYYFISQVSKKDFNSILHQFIERTHSFRGNKKHIHHYLVISTLFRLDYELGIFTNHNWERYNIDYDYILRYLDGFKDDPRTEWLIRYLKTRLLKYDLKVLVTDLSQKSINLSEIVETCKDEYIVFDFWATWCRPCIKSFPELESFANENSISIIAISGDEDSDRFKNWVRKNGQEYTCSFYLSDRGAANPLKSFGIKAFPSYFVFNKYDQQFFGPLHSVEQVKSLLMEKLYNE